jgi:hypothetical protein
MVFGAAMANTVAMPAFSVRPKLGAAGGRAWMR